MLQLVEKFLRREVFALERADELERVFVGNYIRGRGGEPAEEVVNHGPLQLLALNREIGDTVGRIGHDFGRRCAGEPLGVDCLLQKRIEGRRNKQIKVGDLRELAERRRD